MESELDLKSPWIEATDPEFGFPVPVATSVSKEIMLEGIKQAKGGTYFSLCSLRVFQVQNTSLNLKGAPQWLEWAEKGAEFQFS